MAQAQPGRDTFIFLAPAPAPQNTEAASKQKSPQRRRSPVVAAPTGDAPAVKRKAPTTASSLPPPPLNPALAGVALDPSWPKQLFVISDSVMLGAKPALSSGMPGWQVNFMGRPALMIPKAIGELPGSVGSIAVVALGYNSLWYKDRKDFQRWSDYFDKGAEDMLAALKRRGAKKIVWVLLRELTAELLPNNGTASMQYSKYSWYFPYVNERLRARQGRSRRPKLHRLPCRPHCAARTRRRHYRPIRAPPRPRRLSQTRSRRLCLSVPSPSRPMRSAIAQNAPRWSSSRRGAS